MEKKYKDNLRIKVSLSQKWTVGQPYGNRSVSGCVCVCVRVRYNFICVSLFWVLSPSHFSVNVLCFEKLLHWGSQAEPRLQVCLTHDKVVLDSFSLPSSFCFLYSPRFSFSFWIRTTHTSLHLSALPLVRVILDRLPTMAFPAPWDSSKWKTKLSEASLQALIVSSRHSIYPPFSSVGTVRVNEGKTAELWVSAFFLFMSYHLSRRQQA